MVAPPPGFSQAEYRISCRVPTASSPRWTSAKPAILRVFYPGTDMHSVLHAISAPVSPYYAQQSDTLTGGLLCV